ncbi:response regulator [Nitratireductor aquibiodomus]|uniref:response regulator n=1 Tax=Nitratireductor aquibiodomus TaxID=204799 RepID=UPI00046ABE30|nr:response regulator [Nitratireductor aquibiodomus]
MVGTILVVAPDSAFRLSLRFMLETEGFDVVVPDSLAEAGCLRADADCMIVDHDVLIEQECRLPDLPQMTARLFFSRTRFRTCRRPSTCALLKNHFWAAPL